VLCADLDVPESADGVQQITDRGEIHRTYSQLKSPNSTHARTNSGRGGLTRRGSNRWRLSGSSTVGRLGDTPTSPRNQSYVDHLSSRNTRSRLPETPRGE